MKRLTKLFFTIACLAFSIFAQPEVLTNATVLEMSKIGLDKAIIVKKINETANAFDVSANALIELKKASVADEVIAVMLEKATPKTTENETPAKSDSVLQGFSESQPVDLIAPRQTPPTPKEALKNARTIAIEKSSLNPSRQALEKELFKRKEWQQLGFSIERYKESADLYIEIGFVHFSLITHRYVWRLYDRRSGIVIAAGETTSWGSLAGNLARDISKKLGALASK